MTRFTIDIDGEVVQIPIACAMPERLSAASHGVPDATTAAVPARPTRTTASLFQLVSQRYERGSMIWTSNKSFAEMAQVFGDDALTTAILDRLLHHAEIITTNGTQGLSDERCKWHRRYLVSLGKMRPLKVIAKAFRAGFQRVLQRCRPLPVGSRLRTTR